MISTDMRRGFEAMTVAGRGDAGSIAAGLKREMTGLGLRALAAKALHAAAMAPERLNEIYDSAAMGWLGAPVAAPRIRFASARPEAPNPAFWDAFWAIMETPLDSLETIRFTRQTAELNGRLSSELATRVAQAALAYPGVREAAANGAPGRFDSATLAKNPPDSLGAALLQRVAGSGHDLEILERETLPIADLPPPLDYVNARILQCHDLWGLAAGYETTSLHQIGISAFKTAQFGHHYSALLLGMVLSGLALNRPSGLEVVLDVIFTAWVHGRKSPPLLGADWETLVNQSVAEVRVELGLSPYASPWPADLFEQMAAAA